MMMKIAVDAGHGISTAGKRSPADEREWTFNNKVVLALIEKLSTYEDVQILRLDDPSGTYDIALTARTNKANNWEADVLVSCHHNALEGKWHTGGGVETFTMDHPLANPKSVEIAKLVHPRVVKAMGLRDRGLKKANFHMLRESHMPAILVEGGFMDSTVDIAAMRSDAKLKAQGYAIAEGLAEYFKLKPIGVPTKEVDEMAEQLPKTQKDDMRKLLKDAYTKDKHGNLITKGNEHLRVFSVDHTSKVDNMTRGQAMDLLISYVARTK